MKKSLMLSFFCLMVIASMAQEKFTITGQLEGVKNGTMVTLLPGATHQVEKPIMETVVNNNKFTFELTTNEARLFTVFIEELKSYTNVMVEGGDHVKLSGAIKNIEIKGSKSHLKYVDLYEKPRSEMDALHAEYMKNNRGDEFFKLVEERITSSIKANADTFWGPLLMIKNMSYYTDQQKEWYNWFSDTAKNSFYGKLVYTELFPPTLVGSKAPEFTAKDVNGNEYSLKQLLVGADYLVIDFWASWCSPCRKSIPELKAIAAQYAAKGLKLVSISCDKKQEDWIKALDQEKMPWVNVQDKSDIMGLYGVSTIPSLFIIDKNGVVVGEKLMGNKLTSSLIKIFGE